MVVIIVLVRLGLWLVDNDEILTLVLRLFDWSSWLLLLLLIGLSNFKEPF